MTANQKEIPRSIFTKEFVENLDKEMAKLEAKDVALVNEMNLYFLVYRAMASISVACVCLSYMVYDTEYFMSPIILGIIFAITSKVMLNKTETSVNEIIELNIEKRTIVYDLAINVLHKDQHV